MPAYEYQCKVCGYCFEQTMTIRQHEQSKPPQCPKCKSRHVEQRPVEFQAVTSAKT